ncbi:MAG: hypothetical protein AAF492_00265 [Verrucomicrobiota bacterium]
MEHEEHEADESQPLLSKEEALEEIASISKEVDELLRVINTLPLESCFQNYLHEERRRNRLLKWASLTTTLLVLLLGVWIWLHVSGLSKPSPEMADTGSAAGSNTYTVSALKQLLKEPRSKVPPPPASRAPLKTALDTLYTNWPGSETEPSNRINEVARLREPSPPAPPENAPPPVKQQLRNLLNELKAAVEKEIGEPLPPIGAAPAPGG